jgi:hypothetical protein
MSYARVTQYLLYELGVLALFEHEGSESVPEIVEASGFRQARCAHKRLQVAPDQVVPAHQTPCIRGKNEVLVSPEPGVFEPLFGLPLAVGL